MPKVFAAITLNATASALVLFVATGCGAAQSGTEADGAFQGRHRLTEIAAPGATPTSASPTDSPTRTATQSPLPEATPTARDMRLIRDFVAFAVDPSFTTAAALRFAPRVQLGLGSDIRATLGNAETPEPSAWVLDVKYFQAYVGPFSPLEPVQRHAREVQSQSVQPRGGAFQVSVGDHPHCIGTPVPAPRGLEDHRRVSVQPSEKSIDSCLSWFTIDLFVSEAGRVSAVTLDVWEP